MQRLDSSSVQMPRHGDIGLLVGPDIDITVRNKYQTLRCGYPTIQQAYGLNYHRGSPMLCSAMIGSYGGYYASGR